MFPELTGECGESDEEVTETRQAKVMKDPGAPTQKEIDDHNCTHLPFRSWCPACVTGTAKDRPHRRDGTADKNMPMLVVDCGFLGTQDAKDTVAVQVMKHVQSNMIFANVVPRKGLLDVYGAEELIADIEKLGYNDIILKCDGEAALTNIQNEVRRRREGKTILENSPVGDSRSNGHAERAVQSVAAHTRTLKKGLEDRCGFKLSSDHALIPWLVSHAADLLNKHVVSYDGKTPYERWKGKPWHKESVEFGELVHHKLLKKHDKSKLEDRWEDGISWA